MVGGVRQLRGLFCKDTNPIWGSTLVTSSPSRGPASHTVTLGLDFDKWLLEDTARSPQWSPYLSSRFSAPAAGLPPGVMLLTWTRAPHAIRGVTLLRFLRCFFPFHSRTLVNRLCYQVLFFFPYSEVKDGCFPLVNSPLKPLSTRGCFGDVYVIGNPLASQHGEARPSSPPLVSKPPILGSRGQSGDGSKKSKDKGRERLAGSISVLLLLG